MAFDSWCWGFGFGLVQVGGYKGINKKKGSLMVDTSYSGFSAVGSDGQALPSVDWSKLVPYTGAYSGSGRTRFLSEVVAVSARLEINPNWLLFTMYRESGFKPDAKNPNGTASGLIQFIEMTAKRLGTTTSAIRKMSPVEQMKYVEAYYKPYKGRLKSFFDLYLCTFYPAGLGQPDSYTLGKNAVEQARISRVNKPYDLNKDGRITVGEIRKLFDQYWTKGVRLTASL